MHGCSEIVTHNAETQEWAFHMHAFESYCGLPHPVTIMHHSNSAADVLLTRDTHDMRALISTPEAAA
jgi:hypothetical protein